MYSRFAVAEPGNLPWGGPNRSVSLFGVAFIFELTYSILLLFNEALQRTGSPLSFSLHFVVVYTALTREFSYFGIKYSILSKVLLWYLNNTL